MKTNEIIVVAKRSLTLVNLDTPEGHKKTKGHDMTILETLKKEFPDTVFETHYSDLYLYQEDLQSIENFLKENRICYSMFIDDIEHKTWAEVPFGYMDEYMSKKAKELTNA